jgi:cysteinyl-tRNA synthetase
MIELHNSKTHKLERFQPISDDQVSMYVCGPTVYGPAHIGNARPAIVFDILFRLLNHDFKNVTYMRNITDVDDKIIRALGEQTIKEYTEPVHQRYISDLDYLKVLRPSAEPRATHHISDMIAMIESLIERDHAYVVDGEVFFHVPSNPYEGLAGHGTDALRAGDRVMVDPRKRDARDFVLWKPAKTDEPCWGSPWGAGRPGWHIECSAMIKAGLGETIDIHGGGQDLRFPHHEAENAQSQCVHDGAPLANYWLHNGLLTVDGKKMSKSEGNIILVEDLKDRYPGESIRYYMLLTHYRSPLNWTRMGLNRAHRVLNDFYMLLHETKHLEGETVDLRDDDYGFVLKKLRRDLNTPGAIADLHRLAGYVRERDNPGYWRAALVAAGQHLGLFYEDPIEWLQVGVDASVVDALLEERNNMRSVRDFAGADRIRDQLATMGITLADGAHGTLWRKT